MYERLQESMVEAICNLWVLNGDSATATTLWDTFKSWTGGIYFSDLFPAEREAARSLEVLESEAARCETAYIDSPTANNYLI